LWRARSRTVEAVLLTGAARLLRTTLPMRSWQRLAGRKEAATSSTPATVIPPKGTERRVAIAIRRAQYRSPFEANCLDQALAARWMLQRRGGHPVLVIGLNRANLSDEPHAWLAGERGSTITGGAAMPDYVPVTEFR